MRWKMTKEREWKEEEKKIRETNAVASRAKTLKRIKRHLDKG